ncbi:hypothetical protein SLS62_004991 [Diatrype stigma]|uniref:Uncharacterized protein n=1 Tax=Diatrype stigma TaxID=117547 RepID=A0AAN9UTR5_9PEZI
MCYTQQIHTAHHASLLVFDAAAQKAHACHLTYPEATDDTKGNGCLKCPLHSCCRVTSALIFECDAAKHGGSCTAGVDAGGKAEAEVKGNAVYEEVVYVPFKGHEAPVWEMAAAGGGGGGGGGSASSSSSPAPDKEGEKTTPRPKTKKKWSWRRDKNCAESEVLWDAVAEGGDGLFLEEAEPEADEEDDSCAGDGGSGGNGSGSGSESASMSGDDGSSSRRSSGRISQYYPCWSPAAAAAAAAAASTGGIKSQPGSARGETFGVGGDWDDEHSEEGEIPHMEFWSFDGSLPTPSPTSSSFSSLPSSPDCDSNSDTSASTCSGSPAVPSFGEGVRVGEFLRPLPTGKTVIYLEDPTDVLDLMISELQLVGLRILSLLVE